MALVRCPKHRIPYNDDRPGGCPACEREHAGDHEANAIRALARASKALHSRGEVADEPVDALPEVQQSASNALRARLMRSWTRLPSRSRLVWLAAVGVGLVTAALVWMTGGPRFVAAVSPPNPQSDARPLSVEPNMPIQVAFSVLGVRQPRPHPIANRLARYEYGSDLIVDALNDVVYAMTIAVPGRSWRGLQVGLPERTAEGTLALLGPLIVAESEDGGPARTIQGYESYPSVDQRPVSVRKVEVRPPNGCIDVLVDIRPRVIGLLLDGEDRLAVVAKRGETPELVVTRIHVVSRSLPSVDSGEIVC